MFGPLTNEEEQCIDNILSSGIDEMNDVSSLALSSMSTNTIPCYTKPIIENNDTQNIQNNETNKMSLSSLDPKNNLCEIKNKEHSIKLNENISLSNILKSNTQLSGENPLNIINSVGGSTNDKKIETGLSSSTMKLIDKYLNIDLSVKNSKEQTNKNNILLNNNKNNLINNNNITEEIVINESDNLDNYSILCHHMNNINNTNNSNNINNNINNTGKLNLYDLSGNNNNQNYIEDIPSSNEYKKQKTGNEKYNPKSAALKNLIDRLKQSENFDTNSLYEDNETEVYTYNNGSINATNNSELFTLGNTAQTINDEYELKTKKKYSQTHKIKSKSKNKCRNNNLKLVNKKQNDDDELFDKYEIEEIQENNNKMTKMRNEINQIQNKLKNLTKKIKQTNNNKNNLLKKNNINNINNIITTPQSKKSIKRKFSSTSGFGNSKNISKSKNKKLTRNFSYTTASNKKNSLKSKYNLYNTSKLNASFHKKPKRTLSYQNFFKKKSSTSKNKWYSRDNSHSGSISARKIRETKENSDYREKYEILRQKFDLQREKLKSEKQNIISLQQRIKMLKNKKDSYPQLYEYNQSLLQQNNVLINNLRDAENIRTEQEKLIRSLQKEIDILNKGLNLNNLDALKFLEETYQGMKESLLRSTNEQRNDKKNKK